MTEEDILNYMLMISSTAQDLVLLLAGRKLPKGRFTGSCGRF